jgi:putative transposase
VFTSRSYTALAKTYGLQQDFITPYSPEQNGMVERVIRTSRSSVHTVIALGVCNTQVGSLVIGIGFNNQRCPNYALGMKTPAEAYALEA